MKKVKVKVELTKAQHEMLKFIVLAVATNLEEDDSYTLDGDTRFGFMAMERLIKALDPI